MDFFGRWRRRERMETERKKEGNMLHLMNPPIPQLGDLFDPLFKKRWGRHTQSSSFPCVHMFCLHEFVFVCVCACAFIVCVYSVYTLSGLTVRKKRWNLCNKCSQTAEKRRSERQFFACKGSFNSVNEGCSAYFTFLFLFSSFLVSVSPDIWWKSLSETRITANCCCCCVLIMRLVCFCSPSDGHNSIWCEKETAAL